MAPYSSSAAIQVRGSPEILNWSVKNYVYTLDAHAPTSDRVRANAFSLAAKTKIPELVF